MTFVWGTTDYGGGLAAFKDSGEKFAKAIGFAIVWYALRRVGAAVLKATY
jgi:hypothetical protein